MAESTLSLSYSDIATRVCRQLGYSPTLASNTADVQTQIGEIINSGYRAMLYPIPLPGEQTAHEWSWLKGATTVSTVAAAYQADLADTFGGLEGTSFTFAQTAGRTGPITLVDESAIRALREGGTQSGTPQLAAIRPKALTAGSTGQRWEVIFWPTPDAVYVLTYKYTILPPILSVASPYPLGGETHSELLLAACQQRAAEEADDDSTKYKNIFSERLIASVKADRQKYSPDTFGYNGNRECRGFKDQPPHGVMYQGVQWGLYT